jgi:hypothetical protein
MLTKSIYIIPGQKYADVSNLCQNQHRNNEQNYEKQFLATEDSLHVDVGWLCNFVWLDGKIYLKQKIGEKKNDSKSKKEKKKERQKCTHCLPCL